MATINSFRSNLTGGGARPSQFQVMLTFPNWVAETSGAIQQAKFMVKAASLPASIITPIDVPFRGRYAKIAGERQFANWNVTVLNDGNFTIRRAMEAWSKGILLHSDTGGIVTPTDYTAQLQVQQLDRNDVVLRTYAFYNCYPQNIQEIQLDFGATTQIEEYQIEFSVDYWEADFGITTPVTGQ